jgi:hypothetical protein
MEHDVHEQESAISLYYALSSHLISSYQSIIVNPM